MKIPKIRATKPKELENDRFYIALDIGTELLKSVLFEITDSHVEVLDVAHIQQQEQAMNKGVIQNLDMVISNTRLAIQKIIEPLPPEDMPKQLVLGLAGEYIQGISIIVNYEREKNADKPITEKEQKDIFNRIYKQVISVGKENLADQTGLLKDDIEILHITVTGLRIGGLNTQSLVGYTGREVRLVFYASFAPKTYVNALKKLAHSINMNILGIVAQPFAVARAFNLKETKSAIFIDIGGGTTDVALVRDGNVLETQMFAFGGRVFTRELSKTMNIDYRYAESRKIKYSDKKLDKKMQAEVKNLMYKTAKLWMYTLESAIESFDDPDPLPPYIYLCGGGSLLPDIRNVMIEYPWTRTLNIGKTPKILMFTPDKLADVVDKSGKLTHAYDITPVALAKFAFDRIKNPKNHYIDL